MCRALSNLSLQLAAQTGWVLRGCRELQDRQAAVEAAVDRQDQQAIRDRQVRAALQVLVALQGLRATLEVEGAQAQPDPRVGQVLEEAQAQLVQLARRGLPPRSPVQLAQPVQPRLSPGQQAKQVPPVQPRPSRVRPAIPAPQLRARQERLRQSLGLPEPPAPRALTQP